MRFGSIFCSISHLSIPNSPTSFFQHNGQVMYWESVLLPSPNKNMKNMSKKTLLCRSWRTSIRWPWTILNFPALSIWKGKNPIWLPSSIELSRARAHRIAEAGGGFWRSSSPTFLLKAASARTGCLWTCPVWSWISQRLRLCSLSVFNHSHKKKRFLSYV